MGRRNIETTYSYFDGSQWNANPHRAIRRLARHKVYSYSEFSENVLEEPNGDGDWKPIEGEAYQSLSGLEQGHMYKATPYEESHERCWSVTSLRVGDQTLVSLGIPERMALRTDFDISMDDSLFRRFSKRVISLGGVVEDMTVDFAALQAAAGDADGLRQELERLLDLAQRLCTTASPDASTVTQLEGWRDEAVNVQLRYQRARAEIQRLVAQLLRDLGRSDEKAQAQALLLGLPESTAVIGIDALLASMITARAQALATTSKVTNPKMALLYHVLQGIYASSPLSITFDESETVTVRHTQLRGQLSFTPSGIK